ncbi:uncharacterized protein DUF4397 [Mucilaginibacter oryzae]|uniref:Uncharacterized protein DUF4397 n=1 Tax=Mucilaginibacter oryzae TaxID=468058 RepID=A0A316HBE0_9SPHI|nr:DUF4397 domain-containing protein [Mucilaginibacter oryzae]PWK77603.1 uncharacterized protein DUF4397 [Mucilaginibacter oryzae]
MTEKKKSKVLVSFFAVIVFAMLACGISSCGKGANASSVGINTGIQIVNLSSDIQAVYLYQHFIRYNTTTYTYPNSSGYFYLSTLQPPLQIKTATLAPLTLLQFDTTLKANSKYTLFITGLRKDSTIANSFIVSDNTSLPAIGKGKVRFVNASVSSPALDLRANDTLAIKGVTFNKVSNYVELPAGSYNFTITKTATPKQIEKTLPNVTIQDGRAYTIYTLGVVGRADSLAFGAGVLTNNLLSKTLQ